MRSVARVSTWLIAAALTAVAGCAAPAPRAPTPLDRARKAERAKQSHVAYDAYVLAARKSPGNGSLADALRRVAPQAARHWEARGHEALEAGRITEAWRSFLRVLEIQPDHRSALAQIRALEKQYPIDTRLARRDWQRARIGTPIATPADKVPTTQVASVEPDGQADRPDGARQPPASEKSAATGRRADGPAVASVMRHTAPPARPRAYRFGVRHRVPPSRTDPARDGYLARHVLSRDDDRYDKSVTTLDGITVELRDTDDDPPDADLRISVGKKRVRNSKDLPVGRAVPITGRSGREYSLVVLAVRDNTETVIFGIRAARR